MRVVMVRAMSVISAFGLRREVPCRPMAGRHDH